MSCWPQTTFHSGRLLDLLAVFSIRFPFAMDSPLNTNTLHLVCTHDAHWGPTAKGLLEPVRLQGRTGDHHSYSFQSTCLTALGTNGALSWGSVTEVSPKAGWLETMGPFRQTIGEVKKEKILST